MRLAVKVAIDEAGAHFAAVFRCDDEAGHQGAEVDATHRSRPSWSFLIIKTTQKALLRGYGGSTGAGFGTQLLSGRAKRRNKLSTLAQDAMLSAPDELDRLSRRFDAARNNRGPFPQSRKPS